jgi:Flp pilus assembly protein TadG
VTAVEFAITAPAFFAIIFLVIEGSLLMWTQVGLQHGAEMAARCATINPTLCSSPSSIQNYAAHQTYGLNPPPTTFTYTAAACGNQVSASYTFNILVNFFSLPSIGITAQSCFPT